MSFYSSPDMIEATFSSKLTDMQKSIQSLEKMVLLLTDQLQRQTKTYQQAFSDMKQMMEVLESDKIFLQNQWNERQLANEATVDKVRLDNLKPVLMHIIDMYDRLIAGLNNIQYLAENNSGHFWYRWRVKPGLPQISALAEGQSMLVERILSILAQYGISKVPTVSLPFDPHCMEALAIRHDQQYANKLVLEEVQSGFVLGNQVLRTAKVIVNKC